MAGISCNKHDIEEANTSWTKQDLYIQNNMGTQTVLLKYSSGNGLKKREYLSFRKVPDVELTA